MAAWTGGMALALCDSGWGWAQLAASAAQRGLRALYLLVGQAEADPAADHYGLDLGRFDDTGPAACAPLSRS